MKWKCNFHPCTWIGHRANSRTKLVTWTVKQSVAQLFHTSSTRLTTHPQPSQSVHDSDQIFARFIDGTWDNSRVHMTKKEGYPHDILYENNALERMHDNQTTIIIRLWDSLGSHDCTTVEQPRLKHRMLIVRLLHVWHTWKSATGKSDELDFGFGIRDPMSIWRIIHLIISIGCHLRQHSACTGHTRVNGRYY